MDVWQLWREMARESEKAARLAEAGECLRSAASRYYYSAYQIATALLLYRGLTPPIDREAWDHALTPTLLKEEMGTLIASRDRRNDLAQRLSELYQLRVVVDYAARRRISRNQVNVAARDVGFIFKVASDILPGGLI